MARGGKRPGAGRPKSAITTRARELAADALNGLTPLDYLLSIMRNEAGDPESRLEAAKAAAPYVHPRLQAVEMSGSLGIHKHEDALNELDD